MAWKPKQWLSGRGPAQAAKPKAEDHEPEDDDDDDPILDPSEGSDLRDEDDEEEPVETTPEPAPTPAAGGSNLPAADATAARLASLEAENARLRAQLGEQTLPNAQKAARATAVRLFGQGTPQLKQAKDLITACETVADAERLTASWELALSATPLAANAGARQTSRPPITTDPNAATTARAQAAVARTRPRSVKPGNKEE